MFLSPSKMRRGTTASTTKRFAPFHAFLLLLLLAANRLLLIVDSAPLTYSIPQGGKGECFFERLEANEHLTVSVFILSGAQLRGSVSIQGPVSPLEQEKEQLLSPNKVIWNNVLRYDHGTRFAANKNYEIHFEDQLDFEAILLQERPDYDDFLEDENDQYPQMYHEIVGDDDSITAEEKSVREKNFETYKKRMTEQKKQRKEKQAESASSAGIGREGDPWQRTFQAKEPGYYRACISSAWHPISAEIEFRKSSVLGAPEPKSGHVATWERYAAKVYEKLDIPNAAKEEDVQRMQDKIARLRRLLEQIQRKQAIERHQLALHSSVNARSHSRMVLSSLVETIVYMSVTAFQVYVVKKWFQGNRGLLGK